MEPDRTAAIRKTLLAKAATETGRILFSDGDLCKEFDLGCDHVFSLLRDAHLLYATGSYPSSAFMSITAIEEMAKLEIGSYRSLGRTLPSGRREDHLFSHKSKHTLALQETIVIGSRLTAAVGEARVRELLDMAESGQFVALRESALYMQREQDQLICPRSVVDKSVAREVTLLALEVWDDRLVGATNHTYELDAELIKYFHEIAAS